MLMLTRQELMKPYNKSESRTRTTDQGNIQVLTDRGPQLPAFQMQISAWRMLIIKTLYRKKVSTPITRSEAHSKLLRLSQVLKVIDAFSLRIRPFQKTLTSWLISCRLLWMPRLLINWLAPQSKTTFMRWRTISMPLCMRMLQRAPKQRLKTSKLSLLKWKPIKTCSKLQSSIYRQIWMESHS